VLGATGSVRITGAGSEWSNAGDFVVGSGGSGTLNLADAGTLSVGGDLVIGSLAGASGSADLSGPDANAHVTGTIVVGDAGEGTFTVGTGGTAVAPAVEIGVSAAGTLMVAGGVLDAASVTVDTDGRITGYGTIGDGAAPPADRVVDAGAITASAGTLSVEGEVTGSGLVSIDAAALIVGDLGAGLSVDVAAGGGVLGLESGTGTEALIAGFSVGAHVDFRQRRL
jgi:T5SS/PEP-CTERM-associated repeat protein